MSTIKEQLQKLGYNSQVETQKLKTPEVLNSADDVLLVLFIDEFTNIILNKDNFNKIYSFLLSNRLLLSRKQNKELLKIYNTALKSNFLNFLNLSDYISSIDLNSASQRFQNREKLEQVNTSKRIKKKKKSQYSPPRRKELSAAEKIMQLRATVQIGLGLESTVKIKKVKRSDVVIDKNTKSTTSPDKSILYAAGWSLKENKD